MAKEDWGRYATAEGWDGRERADAAVLEARKRYENSRLSMLSVERSREIYYEAERTHYSRPLFGNFWMTKQVAILFGEPGLGKSALAVQLGVSLAAGKAIAPFPRNVPAHPVLYLDFEMTHRQFADRYTDRSRGRPVKYSFHDNFLRGRSLWHGEQLPPAFKNHAEYLIQSLELAVEKDDISTVIIDNISCFGQRHLSPYTTHELLESLRALRERTDISLLLLAHTPKRLPGRQLSFPDLLGSVALSGIADSVFALGASAEPAVRYLKHIKSRTMPMDNDAANVAVYRLERRQIEPGSATLPFGFTHIGFSTEAEQLGQRIKDKRILARRVNELARSGMSQEKIGGTLGIPRSSVGRMLRKRRNK